MEKTRRICHEVIHQLIDFIPEQEVGLLEDLAWNYNDALYKAPEETIQWERTMRTLQKHIPKPVEDWHFDVLSLFTMRSIEELRQIAAPQES